MTTWVSQLAQLGHPSSLLHPHLNCFHHGQSSRENNISTLNQNMTNVSLHYLCLHLHDRQRITESWCWWPAAGKLLDARPGAGARTSWSPANVKMCKHQLYHHKHSGAEHRTLALLAGHQVCSLRRFKKECPDDKMTWWPEASQTIERAYGVFIIHQEIKNTETD